MPNDDPDTPYFQQVPRTGSFEVSYKGMLIFSKLKGGYWPNCELVAEKCYLTVKDDLDGKDCSQYLAGQSPIKGGGVQASAKKARSSSKQKPIKSPRKENHAETSFNAINEEPLRV